MSNHREKQGNKISLMLCRLGQYASEDNIVLSQRRFDGLSARYGGPGEPPGGRPLKDDDRFVTTVYNWCVHRNLI